LNVSLNPRVKRLLLSSHSGLSLHLIHISFVANSFFNKAWLELFALTCVCYLFFPQFIATFELALSAAKIYYRLWIIVSVMRALDCLGI